MDRLKVKAWANAVWHFEQMLRDPRPAKAEAAAKEAAAPYIKEYNEYAERQGEYEKAAQDFAKRVNQDAAQAKSLATYANQYELEGSSDKASVLRSEAKTLMRQVVEEKGLAEKYHDTSIRLHAALPQIEKMADQARAYASYQENPSGALPVYD